MNYIENLHYSGLTFNTNDEFYFGNERIVIIGFWQTNSGNCLVDLKMNFPISQQTLSIDELFDRYGNLLKTKINNTVINNDKKNCNHHLK
jgi:hypothetical protein